MSEFKVGEVAVLCYEGEFNGREVTIAGEAVEGRFYSLSEGKWGYFRCYPVIGLPFRFAGAHQLRKKRPPEEQTTWQAVQSITGWNPHGVPA